MKRKSIEFLCKSSDGSITYTTDGSFIYAETEKGKARLDIFSGHYYKLRPVNVTAGNRSSLRAVSEGTDTCVPILEIDGLRMHLVKDFKTPLDYSKEVVKQLRLQTQDSVLDTCTGLGYTAIEASIYARKVVSCEISDAVLTLAKWNPWSEKLFNNAKIEIINGNIFEKIKEMQNSFFDAVIHDPPRFSTAGELYSLEFYLELLRVLKPGGTLFHYVGSVGKGKGRDIQGEVSKRLAEAGFRAFVPNKKLQGIFCRK